MKKIFINTAIFLFAVFVTGCVQKTTFAADAVMPYINSGECAGMISVFYDNGREEIACLGYADVANKRPIAMDQIFMQCSQTKGFCGVTIAILLEEGKISLDDPVAKYLPQFKTLTVKAKDGSLKTIDGTALTIGMVMNHTGGFGFETPTKSRKGWCAVSLQDTAKEAAATPLFFAPGTRTGYSNAGIDIGAAVVEVVTGRPWEVFLQERVLDPLGMKDTTFWPTDEKLANRIFLYDVRKGAKAKYKDCNKKWMPMPHNGPTVHPPAGAGLWTTAGDQIKFYKMLMNLGAGDNGVRILKEETVKKYLASSTRGPAFKGGYSLGLAVSAESGEISHGGAWKTTCTVNWKKKQLKLRVLQENGKNAVWHNAWNEAANKFFNSNKKADESYTGRLK